MPVWRSLAFPAPMDLGRVILYTLRIDNGDLFQGKVTFKALIQ